MIFHPSLKHLSSYLDGELSEAVRKKVHKHIEHCEKCTKNIQFFQATEQFMQMPKVNFESITQSVMNNIQDRNWKPSKDIVGEVKSVIGKVTTHSGSQEEDIEIFPGYALHKGQTLKTIGNSKALLEWNDGSQLYINKETELDIHISSYPLTLRIGEIFAMMNPQKEVFKIKTPSAVLSVIGTDFDTEVNKENQTTLRVFKRKSSFKE